MTARSMAAMMASFTKRMLGLKVPPYEVEARTRDGETMFLEVSAVPLVDSRGDIMGELAILHDVTQRKRSEELLRSMSLVDDLTGLHNRRGFLTLARQQLKQARKTRTGLLLIFTDLDDMKWVNDTYGHPAGDQALKETAAVLNRAFPEAEIIARIGGDEFVVMGREAASFEAATVMARLHQQLDILNAANTFPFDLSLSLGVTRFDPRRPCSIERLIQQADELMYEHKRDKKGNNLNGPQRENNGS